MSESSSENPKIIIDEDWKSQVQAEKEEALKSETDDSAKDSEDGQAGAPPQPALPDASFSVLLTTLATQALVALGQTGEPEQGKVPVDLNFAKHCIDTLDILEQKTKGNLTPEETELLARFLHELRMLFVAVKTHIDKHIDKGPAADSPIVTE